MNTFLEGTLGYRTLSGKVRDRCAGKNNSKSSRVYFHQIHTFTVNLPRLFVGYAGLFFENFCSCCF